MRRASDTGCLAALRRVARATLLVSAAAVLPGVASACRCAPPALAGAFERADVVLFARVTARTPVDGEVRLTLAALGEPYKGRLDTSNIVATAADSAGCGIATGVGGVLLVFAERDTARQRRLYAHSCNGTREFDPAAPDGTRGFADVPARQVVAQLQARHAAAQLRQLMQRRPGEDDPASTKLIGLVRLVGLTALLQRPDAGAPRLALLRGSDGLVTREIGYEEPAAVVYARVPGWLRVRLAPASRAAGDDGYGWVAEPADGGYSAYERLLPHRLTYLTAQALRYVWPDPGAGLPQPLPESGRPGRREWPAVVLGAQRIAGHLWLRVDITDRSPCEGRPVQTVASGWIPAYGAGGEPAAWFHSRGC